MAEAAEKKADDAHASAPEPIDEAPDNDRILEQEEIDSLLGLAWVPDTPPGW